MNRPKLWIPVALILSFQLSADVGGAQTASSVATAGAGRASVEAGDVHELNPAMLVHVRGRDFHSAMTGQSWTVGLSDNSPDVVMPAALSWEKNRTKDGLIETVTEDLRLSLAGFAAPGISVGVTGHQRVVEREGRSWRINNGDVGFAWIARPDLGLATVFTDVFSASRELPEDLRSTKRTALGAHYLFRETIRLRSDVVSGSDNDFGKPSVLLGYESEMNRYFLVRIGYGVHHEEQREILSAGFGFNLPRFRLNYGYQAAFRGEGEDRHSVDLGIPF